MIGLVRAFVLVALISVFCAPAFSQNLPATGDLLEGGKGLLLSDAVEYDQKTEELRARGNVEIFFKDRRLFADEVLYSPREDQVRANGNVKIVDPDGSVVFADTVELTGDLATGVVENISARYGEFAKLAARRAVREGNNVSRLEDASYSPCKVCAENPAPLWQIVAEEVEHDQTEQTITYKNPRLEVLGQPVLYIPYFQHPDPNVKRKTGLLQPSFFGSSELGSGIETPYFINLAPNRDITISPLFLTNALPLVNIEYRARTEAGRYTLSASGTVGDRSDGINVSSQRNFRGSLFGNGRFDINEDTAWGFDIERASDDTFLRLYEITSDDRLTSKLYAERYWDQNFWSVSTLAFQGLREEDDSDITPLVLPYLEFGQIIDDPYLGGTFKIDASALAITRQHGGDTLRASGDLIWQRPFIFGDGQLLTLFGNLRADIYNVAPGTDADDPTTGIKSGLAGRFTPQAGAQWSWPFLRRSSFADQVIEPIVQVIVAPNGNNPGDIPNEDSASFEFDETNLFSLNKFPGQDRQESGPRMNVGLRYNIFRDNLFGVSAVLGQSFRLREDDTFTAGSGLSDRASDFVGRIDVDYADLLEFTHRFRLDKDSLDFRRAEVRISGGPDWWRTSFDYVKIRADANPSVTEDRQEFSINSRFKINQNWAFNGNWQRDLEDDNTIEARGGIVYQNECVIVGVDLRRRFTRDRDIEPSTSVNVRVHLLTLG